jgi:serine protease Do
MLKHKSLIFFTMLLGLAIGVPAGTWLHGQTAVPVQNAAVFPRELSSYRDVVKQVLPAVVSIETRAKQKTASAKNPQRFDDPNLPEEFRRYFDEMPKAPEMPSEPNRFGFGSGFFVDPSGVVVTNYHVVEGADSATVHLQDGRKFTSKNIRTDQRTDLAVIVLDVKDGRFPFLEFGDSDAMEIGDRVLAVGAPFGLAGSVTQGIVSAKGRNGLKMNMYEDFLQTDAAINPGNSGGPLVNLEGKVVGINAAIKSRSGGFQGVGLAVASNLAKNVVQSLRTTGTVQRGYLGVQIRELDPAVGTRLGVPKDAGVVVGQVFDNTPASKGNLQAGDIITRIDGKTIKDGAALQRIVATLPINKAADVEVIRDGKTQTLQVTIEAQPAEYGISGVPAPRRQSNAKTSSVSLDELGIEVAALTDAQADDLGFRKGVQGVVITRIQENSLADGSELRRGTVITKIDDQPATTPEAARQAAKGADLSRGVLLQTATPQGGVNYVLLKK